MAFVSFVIPCRNEEAYIASTIEGIKNEFLKYSYKFEFVIVNDGSTDRTAAVVEELSRRDSCIRLVHNKPPCGFGYAIREGLNQFKGDRVIIAMADASDDPKDMVRFCQEIDKGFDCCFGQRWDKKGLVVGYPKHKLFLNRFINWAIRILFNLKYTDTTNAFKCYSRATIDGIKPILSRHFNITVELPLKAIVRGFSYSIIDNSWVDKRSRGESKLKIQEMGSRYIFIIIYVLLEKWLCGKDYHR